MPRLAAVISSSLLLLIATHACAESYVDTGRGWETEALCNFHEVELVDVEDGAEGMGGIGLEVGAVSVFRGLLG